MSSARSQCPACSSAGVKNLPVASQLADVDYFMCADCLHIWTVPKGRNAPVHHITDPSRPQTRRRGQRQ